MKKILTFTGVLSVLAIAIGLGGCATTTGNTAAINASQKEMMLSKAGFITKMVTTSKQQQQVAKLAVGVVSSVKYKGKLLYVYPTTQKDRIFVGKQAQYDAYKKMLAAHVATVQASTAQATQAQDTGAYLTGESAGPYNVQVQEFDGFGPIQDNPAWQ